MGEVHNARGQVLLLETTPLPKKMAPLGVC